MTAPRRTGAAARRVLKRHQPSDHQPGRPQEPTGTLGTFAGVFTPSILTILGLVLFLRLGTVVGNGGLRNSLLILFVATSVSVLTSISLAALATNFRVRGGGVYFLISRTLGVEFGGAVGIVLFGAMSVSVAFYVVGFAEAIGTAADLGDAGTRVLAIGAIVVLTALGLRGADWATRFQYAVMAALVIALCSFFVGAMSDFSFDRLGSSWDPPRFTEPFWVMFAVFFPAITGFTQGVAMSGDLRDPSRSITTGTFAAIGVSTLVYLGAIIAFAGTVPLLILTREPTAMNDLAVVGWLITVGVVAATLSSAMASILGAPRIVQRLAQDKVFPALDVFGVGHGPTQNPRRATILASAIAVVTVFLGDLDVIAPVVSMFFLASYGLINYATYYEAKASSTSFRPRFRWYDGRLSLLGAAMCGATMMIINPLAGAGAALALYLIYRYVQRSSPVERWSDSGRAYHFSQARRHLVALDDEPDHQRDWRPCALVFVPREFDKRQRLLQVADWCDGDVGHSTAVRILEGSGPLLRAQAVAIEDELERELRQQGVQIFCRVLVADQLDSGVQSLIQAHGLGPIRVNTVYFNMPDPHVVDPVDADQFGVTLQNCARFNTNVVMVDASDDDWARLQATPPSRRSIRIWWSDAESGQLLTMLGWLALRTPDWNQAALEVIVEGDRDAAAEVRAILATARVAATVRVAPGNVQGLLGALEGAHLALVPLRLHRGTPLGPFNVPLHHMIERLPVTAFVLATQSLTLSHEPDEDRIAAHAMALDQLATRRRELDEIERSLVEHAQRVSESSGDSGMSDQLLADGAALRRRHGVAVARVRDAEADVNEADPDETGLVIDPALWQLNGAPGEYEGSDS